MSNTSSERAAAMAAGRIAPATARQLARLCDRLHPDQREHAEARLLGAATSQDPVTFGRTCRALQAELDPADAEQLRHWRRKATLTTTVDGMTRLYAELAAAPTRPPRRRSSTCAAPPSSRATPRPATGSGRTWSSPSPPPR